jgi:hypothetical protein
MVIWTLLEKPIATPVYVHKFVFLLDEKKLIYGTALPKLIPPPPYTHTEKEK